MIQPQSSHSLLPPKFSSTFRLLRSSVWFLAKGTSQVIPAILRLYYTTLSIILISILILPLKLTTHPVFLDNSSTNDKVHILLKNELDSLFKIYFHDSWSISNYFSNYIPFTFKIGLCSTLPVLQKFAINC